MKFLVILIYLQITITMGSDIYLKKFMDYCRNSEDCENELLICWENRCTCDFNRGLRYNYKVQKCLVDPGYQCVYGEDQKEVLDCNEGSFCDLKKGQCQCTNRDFQPNSHGSCRPKFGKICNDHQKLYCNEAAFLSCKNSSKSNDGICLCENPTEQFYDEKMDKCVGKLGQKCEKDHIKWMDFRLECSANAKCVNKTWEIDVHYGVCECLVGYTPIKRPDGVEICSPALGTNCGGPGADDDCPSEDFLICSKDHRKCECNEYISLYDEVRGSCSLRVGSNCDPENDKCYKNSWCSQSAQQCLCEFGFEENSQRICKLPQGSNCNSADPDLNLCNTESGLYCRGGKCSCEYDLYEPNEKSCKIPTGEPCDLFGQLKCVDNAHCLDLCTCLDSFESKNGECIAKYGTSCNSNRKSMDTDICSQNDVHLTCNIDSNTCTCDSKTVYDEQSEKCRLKIDQMCSPVGDEICIKNAYCYEGVCECDKNFTRTIDGSKCMKDFQSVCESAARDCNTDAHLVCNEKSGLCDCPRESRIFDFERKSCVSKVGFDCSPSAYSWCISNAECVLFQSLIEPSFENLKISENSDFQQKAKFREFQNQNGSCQCVEGYRETNAKICAKISDNIYANSSSNTIGQNLILSLTYLFILSILFTFYDVLYS